MFRSLWTQILHYISRNSHSVESDHIPCKLGVLATSLFAISDDFKIIYGKFERNEVTFILNFDQFEVIFFGSEVACLSFIFQFCIFTVMKFRYAGPFRRTLLKKHSVSQHETYVNQILC